MTSRASNGLVDTAAAGAVCVLSKVRPLALGLVGGVGVVPRDFEVWFCSPSLIKASTVRSKLPLRPFNTVELRLSSGKPMSRNVASFESSPSPEVWMVDPNTLDGLFTRGGEASWPKVPVRATREV